jgi:hypothetical protein
MFSDYKTTGLLNGLREMPAQKKEPPDFRQLFQEYLRLF